jgi:hypothetical protein
MGARVGNTRLAGQAAAQQRAAASEGIEMRRAALRNAEQGGGGIPAGMVQVPPPGNEMGGGETYPNYRDASRRMRGMGPMNTSNNRY